MEAKERIIVALDVDKLEEAIKLVNELAPEVGYFKIGLEFIYSILSSLIIPSSSIITVGDRIHYLRQLFRLLDGKIFWDGKFNDIPNTVAGASKAVAKIGVKFFNVHASAGRESIRAAVANKGNSLVLGVTVLTSLDEIECITIFGDKPGRKVLRFAWMLSEVGADGIICSPQELEILNRDPGCEKLIKVTPGVRPEWAAAGDQKRVMTPGEAVKAGADYLVIGRPITQPPPEVGSPQEAVKLIAEEIAAVTKEG